MLAVPSDLRLVHRLRSFSRWDAWLVALGGTVVLLGWFFGNEMLKCVVPGLVAMNPVTALGFITAGASLLCFWSPNPSVKSVWGRALAAVLVAMGVLKLLEYFLGWHFSLDQLLFQKQLSADSAGFRNQIAPNTAVNFVLSGLALWFLNSPGPRFSRWAQNVSLVLLFVSLVPLVGYLYRASYLYSVGSYIPMALHTALLFYLLAHGLLLAQTDFGIVALFASQTPGGAIAQRLLPFAFGVPVVLGAIVIAGEKNGLYPSELSHTIVVVGSLSIFTGLIWWNAALLNRADARRREAEDQLKKAHDELEIRVHERTAALAAANQTLQTRLTELQRAGEKIREQAELLNEARDAILVLDTSHRIVFWNKGAERLYGWNEHDALGKVANELLFKDPNDLPDQCRRIFSTDQWAGELRQTTRNGRALAVESRWTPVKDDRGKPKCVLIINTDITEKKNYEEQLLRSQRMESIGALAGGIAHDLNNALAPVILGTELLRETSSENQRHMLLDTITAGAKRGTEMVRQILSFARGSRGQTGPVHLSNLISEMSKIVHDTFPKAITVKTSAENQLWKIEGDVTELHQVLLNLCVNARDAMPQGGQLAIRAENLRLPPEPAPGHTDVPPGAYVVLSVADTGTGIPPEVLPRIFEPFFTTKLPDKGTGLGLSTVAGIIKRHNGFLKIQTDVGQGTEFKIYLPANESAAAEEPKDQSAVLPTGHGELILIMDDEEAIRVMSKTTLENYGYRVVTAPNGLEGVASFQANKDEIKLLVTDSDMPGMDGISAIRAIQDIAPGIRIIIASGARRDTERFRRIDTTHIVNLGKPYTIEQLVNSVARSINRSPLHSN